MRNFSPQTRGLIFMLAGISLAPAMDALAKTLASQITGAEVAMFRFVIQFLVFLPFIWSATGPRRLWPQRPELHFLRGITVAIAVTSFFTSLKWLPLVDAVAIFLVEPLVLVVLSSLILGERFDVGKMIAVIVGFAGALVVIRPNFVTHGWPVLLPLLGAFSLSFHLLLTSRLSKTNPAGLLQFTSGVTGFVFLAAILTIGTASGSALFSFAWPQPAQWGIIIAAGLIGSAYNFLLIFAFRLAPASFLAPFGYFEIVSAALIGYLFFNEFPDALTWAGIAIIIASGIYVIWREPKVPPQPAQV